MKTNITQLAISSLLFAACGSEASSPATFERATDEQLQRTAMAALSGDVLMLSFTGAGYASVPDGAQGCPTIATEGGRRHVIGGCATSDGERVDGEVFLENVPGIFGSEADPTKQQVIEANNLVLSGGEGGPLKIDGTLISNPSDFSLEAAIDVEILGINVRTDSRFSCPDGRCGYEYATLDIAGLGSATLSGTFAFDGSNEISLQLVGADTLVIGTDGDCVSMTVGSRTTKHCEAEGGSSLATIPGLLDRARDLARRPIEARVTKTIPGALDRAQELTRQALELVTIPSVFQETHELNRLGVELRAIPGLLQSTHAELTQTSQHTGVQPTHELGQTAQQTGVQPTHELSQTITLQQTVSGLQTQGQLTQPTLPQTVPSLPTHELSDTSQQTGVQATHGLNRQ